MSLDKWKQDIEFFNQNVVLLDCRNYLSTVKFLIIDLSYLGRCNYVEQE